MGKTKAFLVRFLRGKGLRDALELFKKGGHYKIGLSSHLKRFLKKDFEEEIKFSEYDICLFYKENGSGWDERLKIFFDAVYNFVLRKNKESICSIGFNMGKINSILVKQIQGVREKQGELRPFRWEKMMLQIVIDWARENNIKRIDVIRSEDSKWYRGHNEERCKRMYMKYDVTARRMRFKFDKSRKVYSLYLQ